MCSVLVVGGKCVTAGPSASSRVNRSQASAKFRGQRITRTISCWQNVRKMWTNITYKCISFFMLLERKIRLIEKSANIDLHWWKNDSSKPSTISKIRISVLSFLNRTVTSCYANLLMTNLVCKLIKMMLGYCLAKLYRSTAKWDSSSCVKDPRKMLNHNRQKANKDESRMQMWKQIL